ncbi:hypothetical protein GCM10007067_00450 [Lysobacter bugurensis]|uniref:EF-hand domain-containing protein n=2 Tax=Cognatilysobacter bugurensis TaxID=543356 RepID=A0A918SSG9_9GAMM|nr:hypothetical protein GCM10007067_00450 [Lysobacter bugurensis]
MMTMMMTMTMTMTMMKRLTLPTLLMLPLSTAFAGGPARAALDANGDGAIDRSEAAAHPKLAERFDRLDVNRDGRLIDGERLRHGHRGGVERLDTDRDGRVSRAEFDAGAARAGRGLARIDFAAADTNRDGHLVRTEVRAHHERMRPQREAEHNARADERFRPADLNRDGRLNRIEVDEHMPRVASRFAWLDDNRDGFLSRAELQAGSKR